MRTLIRRQDHAYVARLNHQNINNISMLSKGIPRLETTHENGRCPCITISAPFQHAASHLDSRLGLWSTTTNALRLRALQVRCWNPALVVRLGTRGDGGAIGTNNGDLFGGVDLLSTERRPLRALTTLAAALLLGKESGDPGVVDKVRDAAEYAENNEVQEDTKRVLVCIKQE
jgi:hypothetical protein